MENGRNPSVFLNREALEGGHPMVLVLVGLPGCGKTTFAQQLGPTPGGWTVVAVWMKEVSLEIFD